MTNEMMTFGNHKRSCLTFELSAKVALIGLHNFVFRKLVGQLKLYFILSKLWIRQPKIIITIVFMSHGQDVSHIMLGKHYSTVRGITCISYNIYHLKKLK